MDKVLERLNAKVDYEAVIQSKRQFIDPSFPPVATNIVHPAQREGLAEYLKFQAWRRCRDVFTSTFDVFQGIDVSDIHQGELGNCYYLCGVAAIAEFPDRIAKVFLTQAANESGCYAIQCYIMGKKYAIVVDDNFPYDVDCSSWAFGRSESNEIWVMLLEKVWAKVNGSYGSIVSGQEYEGLNFLTGAPYEVVFHESCKDKLEIWKKIKYGDEKNYIMAASGAGTLSSADYKAAGLVKSHAYSLLGVREFAHNGQTVRLVQLRNPWGHNEWNGEWSDGWAGWTPELKRQLELVDKNDGTFYIPFDQYLRYYDASTICMWKDGYVHSTAVVERKENACHVFELREDCSGYLELCSYPQRMLKNDVPGYKSPVLHLMLGRVEGNNIKYVVSAGCTSSHGNTKVKLTPEYTSSSRGRISSVRSPRPIQSTDTPPARWTWWRPPSAWRLWPNCARTTPARGRTGGATVPASLLSTTSLSSP